jgi:hypothetical protein
LKGLVHQQQLRLHQKGAQQGHAALHAARELPGVEWGAVFQADALQGVNQALAGCPLVHQGQVLRHRQPGHEARLLEHEADARLCRQTQPALVGRLQAADDFQQRGLARARGADDGHELARPGRKGQVLDDAAAIGVALAGNLYRQGGAWGHGVTGASG